MVLVISEEYYCVHGLGCDRSGWWWHEWFRYNYCSFTMRFTQRSSQLLLRRPKVLETAPDGIKWTTVASTGSSAEFTPPILTQWLRVGVFFGSFVDKLTENSMLFHDLNNFDAFGRTCCKSSPRKTSQNMASLWPTHWFTIPFDCVSMIVSPWYGSTFRALHFLKYAPTIYIRKDIML